MSMTSTNFRKPQGGFIEAASGTGLRVTSNSNMVPSVAAGNYWLGGRRIIYAGGTVTIAAAHASLARIDVIIADENGTISVRQGTAAASPVAPFVPDNVIPIARIAVAAGDTSIDSADITDLRDFGGFTVDGTTIQISSTGVISVLQSGLSQVAAVVAAGSGSQAITGNGTAQTFFTDTFTALATGETVKGFVRYEVQVTSGADTPDVVSILGATNLDTSASLTNGDARLIEFTYCKGAATNRGFGLVEKISSGATGTAASAVSLNNIAQYTNTIDGISATVDPAAATNVTMHYEYLVVKYGTGV